MLLEDGLYGHDETTEAERRMHISEGTFPGNMGREVNNESNRSDTNEI